MKLAEHRLLDALCGEYLLGTLRGGARRRFEACVRAEPLVARRLQYLEGSIMPRFSQSIEVRPSARVWRHLERDLRLERFRAPWYRRIGPWRFAAGLALTAVVLLLVFKPELERGAPQRYVEVAHMGGAEPGTRVTAQLSSDGRMLMLQASRPVLAGPNQSYELWLIPAPGAAPISLAVLGDLDAVVRISPERSAQLRPGAALAISSEPAGGSPTGRPTGEVILTGRVGT